MIKADLHLHSFHSPDAISSPQAICQAAIRKGLNAVALTDHDTTAGWRAMRKAAQQAGLLFIPGEERKVIANGRVVGEVLCLFLREPVQSRDLAGIVEEVQSQGGLVVAAHPFDRRRPALGRYEALAEYHESIAFETLNGRSYGGRGNHQAAIYATIHELPVTAGSDAHTPYEVGNVSVEAEGRTAEELKQAILHYRVLVHGRVSHPIFSFYSGMRKLGLHPKETVQ
jgi:predicted metal-dependent phosphoesterase TrpH